MPAAGNNGFRFKKRSVARVLAGQLYYRFRRYAQWSFGGRRYSRRISCEVLPAVCASHSTPLIRNLADADMLLQRNKVTNLRLAAAKLNGVVVYPGETFSFWRLVGSPTKSKGYLPGMVLESGSVKAGTGGGLCQLTNLIYWMALHTPLTVTERYRHSYDLFPDAGRKQPFGSGATCSYCSLDLQIRNDTDMPFQLVVKVGEEYLSGCWRCAEPNGMKYEVYEKEHAIVPNAWGGYIRHNTLWRRVYGCDGELMGDDFLTENNALMMYQPYLAQGDESIASD